MLSIKYSQPILDTFQNILRLHMSYEMHQTYKMEFKILKCNIDNSIIWRALHWSIHKRTIRSRFLILESCFNQIQWENYSHPNNTSNTSINNLWQQSMNIKNAINLTTIVNDNNILGFLLIKQFNVILTLLFLYSLTFVW